MTDPGAGVGALARSIWRAPLWAHLVALAVVLVGLCALGRYGFAATSDEGAVVVQARLLGDGGWLLPDPLGSSDPDGLLRPFPLASRGVEGLAPYAKHPLYPVLLAGADDVAGTAGMVGLSLLGAVGAAWAAAALAERLRPGIGRLALWAVGLASPLLFYSSVLIAHTLAAACMGAATLAALGAARSMGVRRWLAGMGTVGAVVVLVLLRSEGALAAGGLAVALVVLARRRRRWAPAVLGVAVMAAAGAAVLAERLVVRSIVGAGVPQLAGTGEASPGWLDARGQAVWNDLFDPGLTGSGDTWARVLFVGFVLLGAAAWALRARWERGAEALVVASGVAAAGLLYGLVSDHPVEVSGLLVAFPLLWVGCFLLRADQLRSDVATVLATTVGVAVVAIVVTDYAAGGGVQWGGRYFAVLLPLAVPLAIAAIDRRLRETDVGSSSRRAAVAGLVVVAVLAAGLSVRVLRYRHDSVASLGAAVAEAGQLAGPSPLGDGGRPAVVVRNRLLPQLLYPEFDHYVWLATSSGDGSVELAQQVLDDADARRVVLVGTAGDSWEGWSEVGRFESRLGPVTVLERQ